MTPVWWDSLYTVLGIFVLLGIGYLLPPSSPPPLRPPPPKPPRPLRPLPDYYTGETAIERQGRLTREQSDAQFWWLILILLLLFWR